jgi:hypothetical protein
MQKSRKQNKPSASLRSTNYSFLKMEAVSFSESRETSIGLYGITSHQDMYILIFIGWVCLETKCQGHFDTGTTKKPEMRIWKTAQCKYYPGR